MMRLPFKKLGIWQKAMKLVKAIYQLTQNFPKKEIYGLTSQIRRSAVSIPSNIAEGSQRISDKEYSNYILIARGSLAELETQLLIAVDLSYLTQADTTQVFEDIIELHKMIWSFYVTLTESKR